MTKELIAKPIVKKIYDELALTIQSHNLKPVLSLLAVGENPASQFYIRNIIKQAEKLGITVRQKTYPITISLAAMMVVIEDANHDPTVNAVMIQKPLPKHIDDQIVASAISPSKDVDGFAPVNLGKLLTEEDALLPCTPAAVMKLIEYYKITLTGKHTVLCGRSLIVGKPLLNLLIRKESPGNATVTVCHSKTEDLMSYTEKADILITALGIPHFIGKDHIKKDAIIIDVGTNEIIVDGKSKYVGDVDYEDCYLKALAITPVPGGVGSITTATLMENIVKATLNNHR